MQIHSIPRAAAIPLNVARNLKGHFWLLIEIGNARRHPKFKPYELEALELICAPIDEAARQRLEEMLKVFYAD